MQASREAGKARSFFVCLVGCLVGIFFFFLAAPKLEAEQGRRSWEWQLRYIYPTVFDIIILNTRVPD